MAVDQFALENHFTVRKSRGRSVVCSRAKNWNSVQKEKNDLTSMKKCSSMECACPWAIVLSRSNKKTSDDDDQRTIAIAIVEPNHNHLCNVALAARSRKSSGTSVLQARECVSAILAPIVKSGGKLDCNTIRKTIEPYCSSDLVLDSQSIANIIRGVKEDIAQ